MELDGLIFLIVNPELGSRSRLREVIKTSVYHAHIDLAHDVKEAVAKLELNKDIDVVMVSHSIGEEAIRALVVSAAEKCSPVPPSYIVTIEKISHKTMSKVTDLYLEGVSGFITEPYSVSDLSSLLEKVREQRGKLSAEVRQKKAIKFLILESIKHINQLSLIARDKESERGPLLREMKEASETLKVLQAKNPDLFAEVMVDAFSQVQAPVKEVQEKRIKRKQKTVLHPGKEVDILMQKRGLSLEQLSTSLKVPLEDFSSFLNASTPVDDKLAHELSRLFGKSPLDWLRMQKEFDHYQECQAAVAERVKGKGSL